MDKKTFALTDREHAAILDCLRKDLEVATRNLLMRVEERRSVASLADATDTVAAAMNRLQEMS